VTGSQDVDDVSGVSNVRISINDLRLRGFHGVYEEERAVGNEFSIDATLEGDFSRAIGEDALENAVDIDLVATCIRDVNRQNQFNLIESFADAIARDLLRRFPNVSRTIVKVTKLTLIRLESVSSSSAEVTLERA
jgi:dihydroneopterin aldolase